LLLLIELHSLVRGVQHAQLGSTPMQAALTPPNVDSTTSAISASR
jgi:hypothetical protein